MTHPPTIWEQSLDNRSCILVNMLFYYTSYIHVNDYSLSYVLRYPPCLIIQQCSFSGSLAGSRADDDSHLEAYRLKTFVYHVIIGCCYEPRSTGLCHLLRFLSVYMVWETHSAPVEAPYRTAIPLQPGEGPPLSIFFSFNFSLKAVQCNIGYIKLHLWSSVWILDSVHYIS